MNLNNEAQILGKGSIVEDEEGAGASTGRVVFLRMERKGAVV